MSCPTQNEYHEMALYQWIFPKMLALIVVPFCACSKWRTQHQPVAEEVSVEGSGRVTEAGGVVGAVDGGVVAAGGVGARRRRSGCPSRSWGVLSRMARSRLWKRSTCSRCPSRSVRTSLYRLVSVYATYF